MRGLGRSIAVNLDIRLCDLRCSFDGEVGIVADLLRYKSTLTNQDFVPNADSNIGDEMDGSSAPGRLGSEILGPKRRAIKDTPPGLRRSEAQMRSIKTDRPSEVSKQSDQEL